MPAGAPAVAALPLACLRRKLRFWMLAYLQALLWLWLSAAKLSELGSALSGHRRRTLMQACARAPLSTSWSQRLADHSRKWKQWSVTAAERISTARLVQLCCTRLQRCDGAALTVHLVSCSAQRHGCSQQLRVRPSVRGGTNPSVYHSGRSCSVSHPGTYVRTYVPAHYTTLARARVRTGG
jgi:hypothetical protein